MNFAKLTCLLIDFHHNVEDVFRWKAFLPQGEEEACYSRKLPDLQSNLSLNPTSAPYSLNKLFNLIIVVRQEERSGIGIIIIIIIFVSSEQTKILCK